MKPYLAAAAAAAAAVLCLASPAGAQPMPTLAISPGATLLNVSAEGRSRRAPDLANFSAGVVTQATTAGEALAANATRMAAVIAALKRSGVADRDIQTASLNVTPQYYYPQQNPVRREAGSVPVQPEAPRIIGYEARNTVQVRVRRLEGMGKVIDTLVSSGANQVDGPSFSLEEPEAAIDEARTQALRKARERAELYARAAGLRVTRIVSISEQGGYFPVAEMMANVGRGAAGAPPPPPSPVQPGELSLGMNLSVQFELAS